MQGKPCLVEPKNYCIVMELAEKGSLETILHACDDSGDLLFPDLPFTLRLQWLENSCSGLDHLHSHSPPLIHRDLKPANVLIRGDSSACLCDFGLCNFLDYKKSMTVGAGTPVYQAPEVRTDKKYTVSVDIWSVGMLMLELVTRERPYHPDTPKQIEEKLAKGIPPTMIRETVKSKLSVPCPLGYIALMNECWSQKPEDRPSCKEILKVVGSLREV